ncbi:F-box domain [Arabidopsis suecica]|uniref:F-box domain n=1 Tax=Arabidopsis suecica TaxID=45249 RepID=A0A8T1ZX15_ARASU|nr:F-box domain [Arabidopsis suecica]
MASIYIPLDLQINTLLRLPVKSLLRFRCVSKLWSSIITSQYFQNRHFNIITSSSAAPRLLIAFQDFRSGNLLLVSSPNPNVSSSCCVPYKDLNILKIDGSKFYGSVRGLVCFRSRLSVGICNPSTRQLHIYPQIKFEKDPCTDPWVMYFFGYDPVEDQYKVLAIHHLRWRFEHKVLVVGGGWRDAPYPTCPHVVQTLGLYMNGTLYYGASRMDIKSPNNNSIIVSFDVRFETFNIINVPAGYEKMWNCSSEADKTLINYRGKIGVVEHPRDGSFRMWVVEDAEKENWSMTTFHLPQSAAGLDFEVMETVYNGEICLLPKELPDPFCLFYYNLKTNSMRSVAIKGLPISQTKPFRSIFAIVSDHYESFMSLETSS